MRIALTAPPVLGTIIHGIAELVKYRLPFGVTANDYEYLAPMYQIFAAAAARLTVLRARAPFTELTPATSPCLPRSTPTIGNLVIEQWSGYPLPPRST
jgi:hypothetical protein